jgi:hypothetical protein
MSHCPFTRKQWAEIERISDDVIHLVIERDLFSPEQAKQYIRAMMELLALRMLPGHEEQP